MENREIYNAHYETINGKKILVIKPNVEEITKEDGTKDIIIKVPSLNLINNFKGEK